jgi:hypothetical protein
MIVILLAAAETHRHPTWADFGAGEWVAFAVCAMIAAWSIGQAVRYTLRPGEEGSDHIKRMILDEPMQLDVTLAGGGHGLAGGSHGLAGGSLEGDGARGDA